MNKIDIAELFKGLQNQMIAQLNTNREFLLHPGTKGDSLENVWIEWLRKYLPNRYCIDKAIIIDCKGNLSDQIDLVIYDQHYTPFVFSQNGIFYIPAEGVYAVFEVKPELTKGYIEYAGDKIESVRKLHRTSTNIIDRGKQFEPRSLTKILGGILTSVSTIQNSTIEKHLESLKSLKSIDLGCSVEGGCFYIDYAIDEDNKINDFNERITNYYKNREYSSTTFSTADKSLVTFFLQLMRYLQQTIGTVAAIDLNAYSNAINFTIDEEL
ncbi:DUF6602 domain-containing protein [Emticicia sp. W12TSBA100-4]|uniref:DUF6602 domain-containing protein n=1 Tax=Emticicia sp. W12TSBA100-4 TaxID=3160965 RepID=UPI0033061237